MKRLVTRGAYKSLVYVQQKTVKFLFFTLMLYILLEHHTSTYIQI